MEIKTKLALSISFFILLALCANIGSVVGSEEEQQQPEEVGDPELKTCKHQCSQQQQYGESDKQACFQSCERYYQMKKERERQIEEETRRKKEHETEEEQSSPQGEEQEEDEDEEVENPFFFEDDDFETELETEDGRVRVLQKFTGRGGRRSELLRGIQNFRLATLEAKGHTFMSPCHFDSDIVIFNVKGRATIGLVKEDTTERFNLEPGDIMRVPAGTPIYVVNRDENEKLFLARFLIPVSTTGEFQAFFGPGGRDPESFLTAFSWELLEAALKSPRDRLKGLFKQQEKGSIFKISQDHVQALSKVKWGFWPFGGQSDGPFNLLNMRPYISNQHGRLYQSTPDDQPSQLKELNLILSFFSITKGSMTAPLYMTKATKICMVTDGKGYLETVCPHVTSSSSSRSSSHASSQGQKSTPSYHMFSATLKPRVVFVVPAGHPFIMGASNKNNLNIICFEVNARGNKMFTFAGKRNVVIALDKEAKQLAFNYPADKVDEIFSRDENFFFPGPDTMEEREQHGRAYA